ncbi:MAG: tRNA lysidine(34) synthetase TilS [Desulfobacteraceae bacterium]
MGAKNTAVQEFVKKAKATARQYSMFERGDSVLAGVSGGPDSVALVLFLLEIKDSTGIDRIGVAHLNHMLRGEEADRDQGFVKNLAQRLGLDFYTGARDVPGLVKNERLSMEDAARKARFSFLSSIMSDHGYTRIALGHHADDDAELVLMNLLRGAGPAGLSGIPPVRSGHIVRPFIRCTKDEIREFLDLLGQGYVTDSSNSDSSFLRNRVRHNLIPHLETEYNPSIKKSLNRLGTILKEENDWMESHVSECRDRILLDTSDGRVVLDLDGFNSFHPAVRRRLSRWAVFFVKGDLKRISLEHIDGIRNLALLSESGRSIDLPGRVRVAKQGGVLVFKKEERPLREIGKEKKRRRNSL